MQKTDLIKIKSFIYTLLYTTNGSNNDKPFIV